MRLKNLDLVIALFVVVINVGWTLVPNRPLVVGIIFALPLIFFLPGYMIAQTLLRRYSSTAESANSLLLPPSLKIEQPINIADHLILSLGLSMAVDVVVGFTLNILPIGLQGLSWVLSLGLITTVFALLVAFLRRKEPLEMMRLGKLSIPLYKYMLLGLAVLFFVSAIYTSMIRPLYPESSFTQFWMLPAKNNSCEVLVGIHNFETTAVTYRIVVTNNKVPVTTWSSVVLAPQQEWSHSVSIKAQAANNSDVEALLYRANQPETIYREVHMTLNTIAESGNQKMSC